MKQIVIIGGGFAGINVAKELARNKDFTITLVDRNNYNFFPPLLYQVATSFLEPSNISYPFRKLIRRFKNVTYRMGEFHEVIPAEKKVILSTGTITYDYLVFATGAETNYFGMENVKQNALPMKTVNDALLLRNHFLQVLEQATVTADVAERTKLLTFVVAGGGPTGVEVSGMLAEMRRTILPKDYPEISGHGFEGHIYLVDGGGKLLKPMSEKSQQDTLDELTRMGVEVLLNHRVKDFTNDVVTFTNDKAIPTKTLVWAAGVSASVLPGIPATSYGASRRLITNAFHQVKDLENIYAIGDTAILSGDDKFPDGHPQVAQVAIQQGKNLAKNFEAWGVGKPPHAFSYFDKGTLAIIGRNKAVADFPLSRLHMKGFFAWLIWIFIHLASLINYRNRMRTFYNWAGAYLTRDQSLRMIIRPGKKE
ncbi:NADH dehydrogenase [Filimonas lacunae]|uniref:NADH:ubiquinone reductase (non-electrogenic) n=1 Tax=Filimonas lacunae TaxID=477680 RepID=A0A173MMH1_9BACT|nr:NAD(P)/FAD-dependent oxidoreductase [Filimonas lacunae]BAV08686.1 NADH dehydrogenase [Filimonas lacunae]SIS59962.1 NADH dehydrogenase [Filimonas lacunae]